MQQRSHGLLGRIGCLTGVSISPLHEIITGIGRLEGDLTFLRFRNANHFNNEVHVTNEGQDNSGLRLQMRMRAEVFMDRLWAWPYNHAWSDGSRSFEWGSRISLIGPTALLK